MDAHYAAGILEPIVDTVNKTNKISTLVQLTLYWMRQKQGKKNMMYQMTYTKEKIISQWGGGCYMKRVVGEG